ncbi:MAG: hypothetical protein IKM40_03740 [Clostridia bacterium]|nr:hypothetical protein [Clostridia bacterium]
MREKLNQHLETFIGKELFDIHLVCEMMCFEFGDMALHAQSFTRILRNDEVLVTTLDYQGWDEIDDKNNDEWYNMHQFKHLIIGNKIERIELSPINDLFIYLDNGVVIQSFAANGPLHWGYCNEQWRLLIGSDDSEEESIQIVAEGKNLEYFDKV